MREFIRIVEGLDLEETKWTKNIAPIAAAGYLGLMGANTISNIRAETPVMASTAEMSSTPLAANRVSELPVIYDYGPEKPKDPKSKEAYLMALTMWGEARNGGIESMRAIGHVIMNRLNSERDFGDGIIGVIWKRKAFSCWNANDPNREAMRHIKSLPHNSLEYKRFKEALELARNIISGHDGRDPTGGALFYHVAGLQPSWSAGVAAIKKIAGHLFYADDAKAR